MSRRSLIAFGVNPIWTSIECLCILFLGGKSFCIQGKEGYVVPYKIEGPSKNGIWTVVYSGDADLRDRTEALEFWLSSSRGKKVKGLIVDLRGARIKMSTMDEHDFAVKSTQQKQLEGVKIAFLHREDARENEFVIQMIKTRGRMAESFTDPEAAYAWLLDATD
jgi:hypothetical protein